MATTGNHFLLDCLLIQTIRDTVIKFIRNWKAMKRSGIGAGEIDGSCMRGYCLLIQRTQVQFTAPTWHLTTGCNSRSRGSAQTYKSNSKDIIEYNLWASFCMYLIYCCELLNLMVLQAVLLGYQMFLLRKFRGVG